MKMTRRTKTSRPTVGQVNMTREARHIAGCAARGEIRIVTIGPLLFFSTETCDAWVLDPGDQMARCLVREGMTSSFGITETPEQFAVEWTATYQIEGELMIFTYGTGRTSIVAGYPVDEIRRAVNAARLQGTPSTE